VPRRGEQILSLTLPPLVIFAVAAVALAPALRGALPVDVSGIFFLPSSPWEEARPVADSNGGGHEDAGVEARRDVPWRIFLADAAARGESVLWNPLEGCGVPHLAVWRTRTLSPFSLPFYLLPFEQAIRVSAFLKLLVAGFAAYAMARAFGLPVPMALFLAVAFELSGLLLVRVSAPFTDVLPWLPLVVLFADRFSLGFTRLWPVAGLVFALMLLGGEPELAATALLGGLIFMLVRQRFAQAGREAMFAGLGAAAGAGVLALVLAAVQVVPYVEFLFQATGTGAAPRYEAPGFQALAALFWPYLTAPDGPRIDAPATLFHVGLLALLFVPVWLSLRTHPSPARRHRVEALLLTGVVMTAVGMLVAPVLRDSGLLAHLGAGHFLAFNALIVALTAAEAADEWVALDADACAAALRRLALWVPVFVVAAGGLGVAAWSLQPVSPPLWLVVVPALGVFVAFVALMAVTLLKPSQALMGGGLVVVTTLELLAAPPRVAFSPPGRIFPDTQFIMALRDSDARVSGRRILAEWPLQGNRVPQIYSPSGVVLRRNAAFLSRIDDDPRLLRRMGSRALLLAQGDIQGAFVSVRPFLAVSRVFDAGAVLFDDLGEQSRARVATVVREVEGFDPADLSSDAPPLVERVVPHPAGESAATGTATIVEESNTRVVVALNNAPQAQVVLADSWYPGWRARVDGVAAPVFPVDGMFRGVKVPAGAEMVEFTYRPWSLRAGAGISGVAFVVVLGLVARNSFGRRQRRR
jgi:hypothetical protein